MAVQTLFHIADLESMPDSALHRELVEGELIELPPAEWSHSLVARRIFKLIDRTAEESGLGLTLMEAGFKISGDDRNWVQPDVSFILAGRVPRHPEPKFFSGAPDLAVEVISPSETAEDVNRKIELLLRYGSREVWAVYPRTQTVELRRSDGSAAILHASDTLLSAVLGGANLRIRRFFED